MGVGQSPGGSTEALFGELRDVVQVLAREENLSLQSATVFQGHAVWSSDQLMSEVARGSWGLARAFDEDFKVLPDRDAEEKWEAIWHERTVLQREGSSAPLGRDRSDRRNAEEVQIPSIPGAPEAMALITGGLGGLGMLAANELAIAGKDHIVATSRSGKPTGMPPALQQLMAAMQTTCPHYMVKADGSDGAVMMDTIQAFCRPGLLAESAVTLGTVISQTRAQLETMPEELVRPSLETLERIKKEIIDTAKEASDKVHFGADVTVEDAQEVRDREDEVVDTIAKLKQRAEGGVAAAAGAAQLRAIQKTGSELAEQVQETSLGGWWAPGIVNG
eukprot:s674_g13.t1